MPSSSPCLARRKGAPPKAAVQLYQVPSDVYGDLIMTVVRMAAQHRLGTTNGLQNFMHTSHSVCVFTINVGLQVYFPYMLYAAREGQSSEEGMGEHIERLHAALAEGAPLPGDGGAVAACMKQGITRMFPYIHYCAIFLWVARMLQEISESLWLSLVIARVEEIPDDASNGSSHSGSDSEDESDRMLRITEDGDGSTYLIGAFSRVHHVLLIFLVGVLKSSIAVWVTAVGCIFLMHSHTAGNLVTKAISLQYFVGIDELLFQTFTTPAHRSLVASSKLQYRAMDMGQWNLWIGGWARLFAVVGVVLYACCWWYRDLQHFRWVCNEYESRFM